MGPPAPVLGSGHLRTEARNRTRTARALWPGRNMGEGHERDAAASALERVLASATFQGAARSRALLKFLVEETLAGRAARRKEYTLGAEALEKGDAFDPRTDPIVRAEASLLRTRLDRYYETEGGLDPLV